MQVPQVPSNEQYRIEALRALGILDTFPEAAFDDIVRLAAHILNVPIALVSLVDTDRQWFKARYGLDVPELPRDVSFCGHVVGNDAAVIVPDAHADARFVDNPVVTGPLMVRFYAGMPLRTAEGHVLGALCAIDHVPRQLSQSQIEMLEALARHVMILLEKRRLRLQLADENASLRASESRLASVFETMSEGVVVQNGVGEIIACNAAATNILCLSEEQLRGRTSVDPQWRTVRENGAPFPGEEHPAMRAIATGLRQADVVMGVHTPEGGLHWISINSRPSRMRGDVVEEVVTTFRDITPLRRAAERMAEQDRLATTGTLAAGIGHEINNPLAYVLGNLDLALEELATLAGPSPSARLRDLTEMLSEARTGADRIRRIVRGLRALSREAVQLEAVELGGVVETSISMAQHEIRPRAAVSIDVSDLPPVLGDESRITQVLVNLLVNAAQAFGSPRPDENTISIRGKRLSDTLIRLTIEDNGPGVPESLQHRIFDPFFTTKDVGEGTGLGLAVSRGIAQALGGYLTLESAVGGGAAFHLDLQIAQSFQTAFDQPVVEEPRVGGGTVLLIDDDAAVLSTMRKTLAREHTVTAVTDPRTALAMLDAGQRFDVIFCDIMMPHLTGEQLFQTISATHPTAAESIVFVTGGATNPGVGEFLSQRPDDVLEKPFGASDLLNAARRHVLRRRQAEQDRSSTPRAAG